MGSWNHHSSPWTLILRSQSQTQYSMATIYLAVTPSVNKEHYTPHLDPAVLVGIPPATCSVGSEEPQPPSASGIEELPTIDIDVTNQPTNPSSSQNETTTSSSATPPPRRYPLRLQKSPEKLNLRSELN